ncbi:MAG: flagellar motor switch protein FliN [Vampirovibrionales bacterium]|nr:flagellar motor switch protein FliN [Vampirovibrionales bacterium]
MTKAFEPLFQLEWEGACRALSMVLGNPVEATLTETQALDDLQGWLTSLEDDLWMAIGEYSQGPKNPRALLISAAHMSPLADLMLGGQASSSANDPSDLSDLQLGALGEAVNQLFSGAAQEISHATQRPVEVSNPILAALDGDVLDASLPTPIVVATLRLTINANTPLNLTLYWLTHQSDAEALDNTLSGSEEAKAQPINQGTKAQMSDSELMNSLGVTFAQDPEPLPDLSGSTAGIAAGVAPKTATTGAVSVRPVQFTSFDNQMSSMGEEHQNLGLLLDVQLNLAVELGKTELPIRDVLALSRGSVIELDRIAGEPVDLLANGRLVAKGEVVVIEDHFGLRITNILSPAERLQGL